MSKKEVHSSNLALRFLKRCGWTKETLEQYLIRGKLIDTQESHDDDEYWAYYILDVGSRLDMKKLYEEQVSVVYRAFDDYPNMTDLEFMESKNW
jgi:ribosomal protein S18 acetylase RimI-like enzyme